MIKFKDVAHLYLNVECQTPEDIQRIKAVYFDSTPVFYDTVKDYEYDEIKPLLRPLSDMTEEERVWFKDEVLPLGKKHDMAYFQDIRDAANIINRLRNKGFDCDGLIESGEAIDKTKHK
jgi:hypothetical protein